MSGLGQVTRESLEGGHPGTEASTPSGVMGGSS